MRLRRWIDIGKNYWTDEEIKILEDCYKNMATMEEIKRRLPNRTVGSSMNKASKLGFSQKYMKSNHPNFKAEYQDYDWCYEHFINQGKTIQQISDETGYSRRVLEKWIREKHGFSNRNYRQYATITPLQYSIILAGTLGDGHIDKREKYAIYIESHAENQKDYMFWKYEILKNLCASSPSYYKEKDKRYILFNSNDTKIIDQKILKNIPNHLDIVQYKIINRRAS